MPGGVLLAFEVDDDELPPQPSGTKMKAMSTKPIQEPRRSFGQTNSRLPAKMPQLKVVMPCPRNGTVPAMFPAAVETVSVDDCGVVPASLSVAGLKLQEAPAGNPLHVKVTLPA